MVLSQGIDIVSVARIKSAIERGGNRFLARVFTRSERSYCHGRARIFEHYAVRFAAKEAFLKVLGDRAASLRLNEIEVCKESSGKPFFRLTPRLRKKAGFSPRAQVALSLSHEKEMAVACVTLLDPVGGEG